MFEFERSMFEFVKKMYFLVDESNTIMQFLPRFVDNKGFEFQVLYFVGHITLPPWLKVIK